MIICDCLVSITPNSPLRYLVLAGSTAFKSNANPLSFHSNPFVNNFIRLIKLRRSRDGARGENFINSLSTLISYMTLFIRREKNHS